MALTKASRKLSQYLLATTWKVEKEQRCMVLMMKVDIRGIIFASKGDYVTL
jgi:hypothetical protein